MPIWTENRSDWRQRAAEARALAEKTRDPRTREDLLAIAGACDRLAELAEGTPRPDAPKPLAYPMAG
jgi:hypothetical protein